MTFPFIAAALIASAVSATASVVATEAQVKAVKKENKIRRRVGSIERNKRVRQAIAQRRVQEAEFIQAGQTQGGRTNSAISGAVGSLRSDTGSSIGLSNTQFAGDTFANRTRLRGISRAGTFGTISNVAGTASSLFAFGAGLKGPGGGTAPGGDQSPVNPYAGFKFG